MCPFMRKNTLALFFHHIQQQPPRKKKKKKKPNSPRESFHPVRERRKPASVPWTPFTPGASRRLLNFIQLDIYQFNRFQTVIVILRLTRQMSSMVAGRSGRLTAACSRPSTRWGEWPGGQALWGGLSGLLGWLVRIAVLRRRELYKMWSTSREICPTCPVLEVL